ncbi:GTP cyclohydrolase, partial [Vibrio splendidus]
VHDTLTKEPRTGGVIISTISDRNELNEILALDPLNREGLANYEVTEIVPTKASNSLKFLV